KKGELLRPDAFTRRDIEELRASKRPGFETLQQQNPGRDERLRMKAECFSTFAPSAALASGSAVILSIDPGQKGGPSNSFSVVQAWAVQDNAYLLLDQWREQTSYRDFRSAVQSFIRKYRPSAVLIEDTWHGPALCSEIRPQNGMAMFLVTPRESKIERLRKHRRIVRRRVVHLPQDATWRQDFLNEAILFPYGEYDDQMDALSQFLEWIINNPTPPKRPPMAVVQGVDSQGRPLQVPRQRALIQTKGAAIALGSGTALNGPFAQPKTWVQY